MMVCSGIIMKDDEKMVGILLGVNAVSVSCSQPVGEDLSLYEGRDS